MLMKQINSAYNATACRLYQQCLKEWWPALDAHRHIYRYKKSELVFAEGDPVEGMFFVLDGVVKVHKHWTDDKDLILRFASKDDILGHRGLTTHSLLYPISATCLSPVTILFLPLEFFRTTLTVNTNFLYQFMMFFADELHFSEQRMQRLAHMQVRGRVVSTLEVLQTKFGQDTEGFIAFEISRQDIASYAGTTYETVYKLLIDFENQGMIRTAGKKIQILNPLYALES